MKYIKEYVSALLAGFIIAIGGCVYLSAESKALGACLFTIGLFIICTMGLNLFTGKVCYIFDHIGGKKSDGVMPYGVLLVIIWLGNLSGTVLAGLMLRLTRIAPAITEKAAALCETKLSDDPLSIVVLAFFCNVLIYLGVESFKNVPHELGKYLALFLAIMVFILCGFEHCVANMFYFTAAGAWSLRAAAYLLLMTLGNGLGGLFFPVLRKVMK